MVTRTRGQREGSIYKRADGKYVSAVPAGRTRTGKRRRITGISSTAAEAISKLRELHLRAAKGVQHDNKSYTVASFAAEYLEATRLRVKPSTYRRYEILLRVQIVPELGHMRLQQVKAVHLERLYVRCLDRGLAPQTVVHVHRVMHALFAQALRWQINEDELTQNIVARVKPPRVPVHEMQILDTSQSRSLLDAAVGTRLEAFWHLAIGTAMRLGELLALKWNCVDLEAGTIRVDKTLTWVAREGPQLSEPKTRPSRRLLHLTRRMIDQLSAHQKRQLEDRLRLGSAWDDEDFVFTSEIGTPLRPENVTRRHFRPVLRAAGITNHVTIHDLRHTAISYALAAGVAPTDVANMAGHSSVAVTLTRYAHALPNAPERAINAIETVLSGSK